MDDLSEPPLSILTSTDADTESPFGNPLVNLHNCETIALPDPVESEKTPRKPKAGDGAEKEDPEDKDPLSEATYFRAHRRNERQEKQLRNIERERAQHEKQQLDRLVDELQGQDWLRVMGISGPTDQDERKQYESKRDFFVGELSALIQKFKIWREEEKRRKADKEKLRVESAEDLDATPQQHNPYPPSASASTSQKRRSTDAVVEDSEDSGGLLSDAPSHGETPDVNDVDAWAARQLHQEARSATAGKKPKASSSTPAGEGGRKKPKPSIIPSNGSNSHSTASIPVAPAPAPASASAQPRVPLAPPVFIPEKPFISFFAKRSERDTALTTHRKGRMRLAFGHPVPEPEEREFELPADILTPEAIDSCRRKRRRMKRASRTGT